MCRQQRESGFWRPASSKMTTAMTLSSFQGLVSKHERRARSLEKGLNPGLEQGKFPMSPKYTLMPERKEGSV